MANIDPIKELFPYARAKTNAAYELAHVNRNHCLTQQTTSK